MSSFLTRSSVFKEMANEAISEGKMPELGISDISVLPTYNVIRTLMGWWVNLFDAEKINLKYQLFTK